MLFNYEYINKNSSDLFELFDDNVDDNEIPASNDPT